MSQDKHKVCGAQLRKKPGKFCQQYPLKGKKRCRIHGGKSLGGVAAGKYKHGRYSRYLPTDLRKQYEESKHDPELVSHQPDLRLMDVHLQNLLTQLDSTKNIELFLKARKAWAVYEAAEKAEDDLAAVGALATVGQCFSEGIDSNSLWEEIQTTVDLRRKLCIAEARRIQASQTTMSSEQVMALIEFIVDVLRTSVNAHVSRLIASKILQKVTNDIGLVVSKPDQASAATAALLA